METVDQRNRSREGLRRHTQRGTGRARSRYRRQYGLSSLEIKRPLPSGLQSIE
jgi:hypothetical protein